MIKKEDNPNCEFDVAIVDVDSLIYSITWVHANRRAAEKALITKVEEVISNLGHPPDTYVFVKGNNNFRYQVDSQYKANRMNKIDPEMQDRINDLYTFAQNEFIKSDGGEADDYCSIYAYQFIEDGKVPVVCHIDKDLNMIPGWHWNYKKNNLYFTSPQDSFVTMMRQLITGDASDNVPGLYGVGDVGASKDLNNKFLHEMRDRVLERWRDHSLSNPKGHGKEWEERFLMSANCLIIRESLDELRPLTKDEIWKKMEWNLTEERYMLGITENLPMLANQEKNNAYSTKREARLTKTLCVATDTGNGTENDSTRKTTTDSSISSTQSSPTNSTSERKASTASKRAAVSDPATGKSTRPPARKSIVESKNSGKKRSTSLS
jgi:5'-3' exonuclease